MTSTETPLGGVLLAQSTEAALEVAATKRDGQPLGTFRILSALISVDMVGDWSWVQLQATYIDHNEAERFLDRHDSAGGAWKNVPLTEDATVALQRAVEIGETYRLFPLPPGVLALGLVWDRDSGAARALLDESEVGHGRLLDLIQEAVLGTELELPLLSEASVTPLRFQPHRSSISAGLAAGVRPREEVEDDADPSGDPEAGWSSDWQLFETPESRRLDAQVKLVAVLAMVLLIAFCLALVTELVSRTGYWALVLVPVGLGLTSNTGPPKHHPLTGLLKLVPGVALESPLLITTAALLILAESADHFFMPRMVLAGRGGALPSSRAARRERVAGLLHKRRQRIRRLLAPATAEDTVAEE